MRTFKKSSTAVIATLALGLLSALPASAQTVADVPAGQTYTVRIAQTPQTGSGAPGTPMILSVVKKPGTDNGEVIISWAEDAKAKSNLENGHVYSSTVEYDTTKAKSQVISFQ